MSGISKKKIETLHQVCKYVLPVRRNLKNEITEQVWLCNSSAIRSGSGGSFFVFVTMSESYFFLGSPKDFHLAALDVRSRPMSFEQAQRRRTHFAQNPSGSLRRTDERIRTKRRRIHRSRTGGLNSQFDPKAARYDSNERRENWHS